VANEEENIKLQGNQETLEDQNAPNEPIGHQSKTTTRNRQAPGQWWKPWNHKHSNATHEPHGNLKVMMIQCSDQIRMPGRELQEMK